MDRAPAPNSMPRRHRSSSLAPRRHGIAAAPPHALPNRRRLNTATTGAFPSPPHRTSPHLAAPLPTNADPETNAAAEYGYTADDQAFAAEQQAKGKQAQPEILHRATHTATLPKQREDAPRIQRTRRHHGPRTTRHPRMLLLFALLAGTAGAAFLLFKFATADGDFTLLSCGRPRRDKVDGKVVWITGASRGIGEVLSMQFASLGAKLILSARNKEELERVKHNIMSKHPDSKVEVLPMDLSSDEESLKEVVHSAESLFSSAGVDYMMHNAAFERPKRGALEETEEGLKATFKVNVFGTITLTRLLAPFMLDRGMGHFVVMSSAAGKVPTPGQALYSASKHALNGYFASLRSELCTKGIKVTVVCPGPIETPESSGATSSSQRHSSEKRVSVERCAELTIVAATHGLKEAWISYQPVLAVMYVVQYMPTIGTWLMDKVGAKRVDAAAKKGNAYSWNLLFGGKKSA